MSRYFISLLPTGSRLFTALNLAFWCGFMHLYWPNNGGSGLSLPFNIIAWLYAVLCIACIAAGSAPRRWRLTRPQGDFVTGGVILCALCLLTPAIWRAEACLVAASLLGGLLFYSALLQRTMSGKALTTMLQILVGASMLECFIFLIQYFHLPQADYWAFPWWRHIRPYGVFQQVNLLASFIASGSLLAALLSLRLCGWRQQSACAAQFIMGFVLHEAQSQTGYLSLLAGWPLLLWIFSSRRRLLWPLALLLSGMAGGEAVRHLLSLTVIDHQQAVAARWDVLRYCARLILERPWFGWGVGSFAYVFLTHFGQFGISRMAHPHNELVLWLVEGGLPGLVGAACFMVGGGRLWLAGKRWQRASLTAALPVVIHMLTEYPVRQSVPHWLLLILLLRCADRPAAGRRLPVSATAGLRALLLVTGLIFTPLLGATLQTQRQLTEVERRGEQWRLAAPLPVGGWLLASRYQFDTRMGYLQRYQRSKDPRWLTAFNRWAADYLRIHPDANVAFTQIVISQKQRDFTAARRLAARFCRQYPTDRRVPWLRAPQRAFNQPDPGENNYAQYATGL